LALALNSVPDYATLYRFLARLDAADVARVGAWFNSGDDRMGQFGAALPASILPAEPEDFLVSLASREICEYQTGISRDTNPKAANLKTRFGLLPSIEGYFWLAGDSLTIHLKSNCE
jgi:hypothetical protein